MAYYESRDPRKKYQNNRNSGGDRYSEERPRTYAPNRFGPKKDTEERRSFGEKRFDRKDDRSGFGRGSDRPNSRGFGHREDRPQHGFGRGADRSARPARPFGERRGDAQQGFDKPRFSQREDRRPMNESRPQRSYRDFEAKPKAEATPVAVETRMPIRPEEPENLLAGRNPIREALKSGRDLEKLLVQRGELSGSAREIVALAREKHVIVQEVDKTRLDEITRNHQGMLAFASAYRYATVEEMLQVAQDRGEDPFLILLDGVTDPHNLGAIIRSAECVGAHGVIVPERRSVGLTPAAVKASAGAIEHIKVARVTNLNRTIEELKKKNIWSSALDMDGEDYMSVNFKGGVALIVGAEGEGISRLTLETCDQKVSLPMLGKIDSLNASVAAGIMMYRVLAARKA